MGQAHDTTTPKRLVEYLATIPDPRSPRGRRYEWIYLLTIIAAALMAGEKTLLGISQWVAENASELAIHLELEREKLPSYATLRRVLCNLSIEALEQAVGAYLRGLREEMGESGQVVAQTGEILRGQAVDGKSVRCATAHNRHKPGAVIHLVSVVGHEHGLVWAQENVTVKMGERQVAERLLANLPLQGTVTTFDALHTSVKQAKQIRKQEGDYLFVVKRNQRTLYSDIDAAFSVLPPQGSCEADFWQYEACRLKHRGHGRTTEYLLESTPALNDYLRFPDVAQVIRRMRTVCYHTSQRTTVKVEYLITSLPRTLVTLAQIATLRRWHWTIENVTHYPRDVSFGEDGCHVRTASAPQALAALRNAIVGTLRCEGWPYLSNGFRYCRNHLQTSLQWIGALAT